MKIVKHHLARKEFELIFARKMLERYNAFEYAYTYELYHVETPLTCTYFWK